MFGRRNDGFDVSKSVDPIVLFTPLIMPTRNESMIQISYSAEYEPMAEYIRAKRLQGKTVSFVSIIAAAYVRTLVKYPYLNYFIGGKGVFCHKDISISMMALRENDNGTHDEVAVKVVCDPNDTLSVISEKFEHEIAEARKPDQANGTADFAVKLLKIPILPSLVVGAARLMDYLGIMPKWLNKISPFHCSFFITNMMSIGLPSIYHHLYNFGTCSLFLSVGKPERQTVTVGGKATRRLMVPLGIVTDERICGGAQYAVGVHAFLQYLQHPDTLDMTPEEEEAARNAAKEPQNIAQ